MLIGTFNKEKALVGAISGYCEASRRLVDSSIQGYAVEIFADTFSHGGQGLRTGVQVDTVAYWSAVVMALVRLGTLTAR